ncbi:MAG: thiamine pyrophosphate-binding protein [Gammaproteobacteria bacterium]|nr:thiamine pyrophosphate-binding protein [Gammaproteobacteria bacterium]
MTANVPSKTVGERLVELFKAEGVTIIFGIGDITHMDVQKHAELAGLKVVGPRHEAAGGFMADAAARMTGRPQVMCGAMGPGVANMLPAAFNAAQEHVPVVFVGAQRQALVHESVRRSRFLHSPFVPAFATVCKYSACITHPWLTDDIVHEAFRQATTCTPGPVYIQLAWDMQVEEWDFPPFRPPSRYRVVSAGAAAADVDRAAALIAGAQTPLLVAGTGIHTARAHDDFERLARTLQCPVIATYGGLGVLPDADPQCLSYLTRAGHEAVGAADVVLAVGTSIPETLNYGRTRHFAAADETRKWIVIERDPGAVGVNRDIDVPLVGDMRTVLPQLTAALEKHGPFTPPAKLAGWRAACTRERQELWDGAGETRPIHPGRLMIEARAAIPDDAVIVHDGGYTLLYQLAYFERRSRDFLWASKFAHLGTGLPYAIGAQLVVGRDRPVCLITGDSSLGFHIMEFETAVRHRLPIVVIVNYDGMWGAEAQAHMDHIGHLIEVEHSLVRLDRIVEAMGGHGELVDDTAAIVPAVQRAFAARKPAVVQVITDPAVNALSLPPAHAEFFSWLVGDAPPLTGLVKGLAQMM